MLKTITIHSYKGGTGKTCLAAALAAAFARKGRRVLVADHDFRAPSFQSVFGDKESVFYLNDYLGGACELSDIICKSSQENMDILFADPDPKPGQNLLSHDEDFHSRALRRLMIMLEDLESLNYDITVIDNSPGIEMSAINALIVADLAVLVLRPNKYGVVGTKSLIKNIYMLLRGVRQRQDMILFNQVPPEALEEAIRSLERPFEEEFDLSILGRVPCICNVSLESLKGISLLPSDHEYSIHIEKIAEKIQSLF